MLTIDPALEAQHYRLRTAGDTTTIAGGSELGVLYGAYRYAELLGVRFYLHEDVLPDEPLKELPAVDETGKPVFGVRGILPFHDFAQGPDLWEADDYKAVLSQMVKLRMNFIGLHTYSECGWGSEPTVWIGMPEDVGPEGRPKFSYASYYVNTERTTGGQKAGRTDKFGYGASELFESDVWGPSVMRGLMPHGKTVEEKNEGFARLKGRPESSSATIVLANVAGSRLSAIAASSARCSSMPFSSAGLKSATLILLNGGTPPWGPAYGASRGSSFMAGSSAANESGLRQAVRTAAQAEADRKVRRLITRAH